jgi:prepilin-type N-terminal cleavage/methylation domain-containing protein
MKDFAKMDFDTKCNSKGCSGYTFVELIIVLFILSALAAVAVPRFSQLIVTREKASIAARELATNLRYTRFLAISDPVATNSHGHYEPHKGYQLTLKAIPGNQISYSISNLSSEEIIDEVFLHPTVALKDSIAGREYRFNSRGELVGSDGKIFLGSTITSFYSTDDKGGDKPDKKYEVEVIATTGAVELKGK